MKTTIDLPDVQVLQARQQGVPARGVRGLPGRLPVLNQKELDVPVQAF